MALKVAANLTTMFPERGSLITRFAAAKSAGFSLVEVSLPYGESSQKLSTELTTNDLKAILINTDPGHLDGGEMGFACCPDKETIFKETIEKSVSYAKAMNVPMVHVMVGNYNKNYSEEEHHTVLLKNLLYATQVFTQEGIIGLIEPKNPITFPSYFLSDYDQAVALLFKIDSPNMRLLLDIFHLQMICGNITRNIDRLSPYIGHVQVSQAPTRNEPCSPGELDFVYIINKLKSAGYKGFIGAEYVPSTKKTEDSLEWIRQCGLSS